MPAIIFYTYISFACATAKLFYFAIILVHLQLFVLT